jgi:hypothetical protein
VARTVDKFSPMGDIATCVYLTKYSGGPNEFMATPMEELVQQVLGQGHCQGRDPC